MQRRSKIALLIFGIFYISFGAYWTIFQESIVYYPNSQDFKSCTDFQSAEKVDYNGTRMYVEDIYKPTVILYHGNAGSACDRHFYADIFAQAGYGYIIVEYAGYSNDLKKPSHTLIKRDVQNVLAYINEKKPSRIIVVGESIGTGVASYHASLQPPDKLLLISPFTDLVDIAQNLFWFYPTSILVHNAFENTKALNQYRNPVTIIHGYKDRIIPHELGQALFVSLETEKKFVTIAEGGHNDLFLYAETYATITNFLKSD